MNKRESGFTLIELMIVVAIIAIIASIAIPNLMAARINANEAAAMATLKNLSSSQAQVQASGVIDANTNGAGEYGYFQELSGTRAVKGVGGAKVTPPIMSGAFGSLVAGGSPNTGLVLRSGYYFQMFLPGTGGTFLPEPDLVSAYPAVDASQAEVLWAAYAWPASFGNSGKRVFFVNQAGDVLQQTNATTRYSGTTTQPAGSAAVANGSSAFMFSPVAVNTLALDGQRWTVVN